MGRELVTPSGDSNDPCVSLEEHFQKLLDAEKFRVNDIIQSEMRRLADLRKADLEAIQTADRKADAYNTTHNGLIGQMQSERVQFITRNEHILLDNKVDEVKKSLEMQIAAISKLVFVGLGVGIVVQLLVGGITAAIVTAILEYMLKK